MNVCRRFRAGVLKLPTSRQLLVNGFYVMSLCSTAHSPVQKRALSYETWPFTMGPLSCSQYYHIEGGHRILCEGSIVAPTKVLMQGLYPLGLPEIMTVGRTSGANPELNLNVYT